MSTEQDFASIVLPAEYLPEWFHLRNKDNSLVRLHSKFWGKSLACEEPELSNNLSHTKSADEDKDKDMDVDAVDNDFIPGCAILDIGIENLPFQKIWIRADYIRVYNFLEDCEAPQVTNNVAPGAVITGQPGIGKSVWVYYALCRRLVERKPVIWYRDHSCFLFLKEGVFRAPAEFPSSHFRTIVWTLVDADESQEGAPPRLLTPGTRLYVIYVTSPCAQRWSQMTKTVRDVRLIMNPWRKGEIDNAASVYGCDRKQINHLFDRLGPTPRLSLVFNSYGLRTYEDDLRKTIKDLTSEALEKLFEDADAFEMGKLSHKICLISRDTLEDVAGLPIVKPITLYVHSKLVCQFRTLGPYEELRLYKKFAKTCDSRELVGVAFEAVCQTWLQYGAVLTLVPILMVHHLPKPESPRPPWYSCHVLQRDKRRQAARPETLNFSSSRYSEYSDSDQLSIKPDVLYVPAMSNQIAFDAFMLQNGTLNIFQFSIGHHHHVKPGLKDFFATCSGIPPMKNWRFVLIVPSKHTLICPQGAPAIPLYSAVMAL